MAPGGSKTDTSKGFDGGNGNNFSTMGVGKMLKMAKGKKKKVSKGKVLSKSQKEAMIKKMK